MSELNESQRKIAETTEGMIVVDAGPGTGKTTTMVERYAGIVSRPSVAARDVVMLTFTRNAAAEMAERAKKKLIEKGQADKCKELQASTFDSFCYTIVRESPETVSEFFGLKESLTRAAAIVENETLNGAFFSDVMDRFLAERGDDYGDAAIVASQHYGDLLKLISKLMSRGIVPLKEGWFGSDLANVPMDKGSRILNGDTDGLEAFIRALMAEFTDDEKKNIRTYDLNKRLKKDCLMDKNYVLPEIKDEEPLPEKDLESVVYDSDRKKMLELVHDAYYEFIRRSVAGDRLTFGLSAVFAFVILYSDRTVREHMRCKYLMIDEFQDTNSSQLMIALMLLEEPNLCVVGDWKQGIYGFRYVSVENITDFEARVKAFKKLLNNGEERVVVPVDKTRKLTLDVNYRSSGLVLDASFAALTM